MAYRGVNALTPFWEYDKNKSMPPRGFRGYRKYKNGLLNVTPIEGEVDIVERNARESPLLRLPPEIRALIWEFTIGGNIIRPSLRKFDFDRYANYYVRPPQQRFSLLRVSRQIYFEAAVLVWTLSTFRFRFSLDLGAWLSSATVQARKMIHIVEFSLHRTTLSCGNRGVPDYEETAHNLARLPNVELYEIQICHTQSQMENAWKWQETSSSKNSKKGRQNSTEPSVRVLPTTCYCSVFQKNLKDHRLRNETTAEAIP